MISLFYIGLATSIAILFRFATRTRAPKGLRLPPGPPPKSFIGNLLDVPHVHEQKTYSEWAKKYGELVYLEVFGSKIVFINSRRLAYELFERRSSIYSDRPPFPMINDLMGFDWSPTFQRYGDWWRRNRRAVHEKFHPKAAEMFKPVQLKYTRELVRLLLQDPDRFGEHVRYTAGAIIMETTYGIRVKPKDDPYIIIAEEALKASGEAGVPGRFLVDILPWMKYIPAWMPGADFQRKANIWRRYTTDMAELPFQAVKSAMAEGKADPSFTSTHLEALNSKKLRLPDDELVIRGAAAVVFAGGSDTTVNTMKTFFLAMLLFPEAQRKAQEELDMVLGDSRLPEFEDRAALPYIVAVYKETLRWHPLLPSGVAHAVTQNDVVEGYFIPKGTIVFGNSWDLLHDENDFGPDTNKFNPDRFLNGKVRDPSSTGVFGFGRRICPGRYMAENSLFIAIATILQLFDISMCKDGSGNDIPPEFDWTSGFFSYPTDFKCTISPRSKAAEQLLDTVEPV